MTKPSIATLPGGIEVFAVWRGLRYNYARIGIHPLFASPGKRGKFHIQFGRVILTSLLGRRLGRNEHVHHGKRGKFVDAPSNLSLLTAAEHNKHHKTGSKHSAASRAKIAAGLVKAYAEGRHPGTSLSGPANGFYGKKHSAKSLAKMRGKRKR